VSLSLSAILLLAMPAAQDVRINEVGQMPADWVAVQTRPITFAQVRIERRVIIRVPRRRPRPITSLADIPKSTPAPTFSEKKIGKCLPMSNILGVQVSSERSVDLITRDRKRIRARLEKKCQAQSSYPGVYTEKSGDGKINRGRDSLHSRTSTKCEIKRFRELVPEG